MYIHMTRLSVAMLCVVALSLEFSAYSYGQAPKFVPHITDAESRELLKSDPTLSSGFETSEKVTVRVVKIIKGGIQLQFNREQDGLSGQISVLGPPSLMEKDFFRKWLDGELKLVELLIDEMNACPGGVGGAGGAGNGPPGLFDTPRGTFNITMNTVAIVGNVTVNCTSRRVSRNAPGRP